MFPIPVSKYQEAADANWRTLARNGKQCHFLLDFKTGPSFSCDGKACGKKKARPPWVMSMDGKIQSQDCEIELNVTTKAFRIDMEKTYPKAVNYSLLTTVICLLQIGFLFRQLHFSQSQAAASRVSLICIGQQSILDAILCVTHLLLCAIIPQLFTAFASIAFFKLIIFCIVEMKYIVHISQSRDPQRFFNGGLEQMRHEFAILHARFYAILIICLPTIWFLFAYVNYIVLLAYSYWVPQIVTNAMQETRQPFHKIYLYGISCTRLVIPLYIYGFPDHLVNVFLGEKQFAPNYTMCLVLVLWTGAQVGVLMLQQKLGPRFFIPARFLPPKYSYTRPIPRSVLESAEESGVECVICYSSIETHPSKRDSFTTPCDHVFHEACLTRWMEQKMEWYVFFFDVTQQAFDATHQPLVR
mmetsp:Transcript_44547/g.121366  ORF Transcript_44547/g.121366 Transcript_44547/m.121366 type:complete len:413 (+) Transcript_44547:252-1490(+)